MRSQILNSGDLTSIEEVCAQMKAEEQGKYVMIGADYRTDGWACD